MDRQTDYFIPVHARGVKIKLVQVYCIMLCGLTIISGTYTGLKFG